MIKIFLTITLLGLPSLTSASLGDPDFSGCGFRIKAIPQGISLARSALTCQFTLSDDNKKSIVGSFVWKHELSNSDTSEEIGRFKAKRRQVQDYIGYQTYFDSRRNVRQKLLKKKVVYKEENRNVQKWVAQSLIRLSYPEDLLGEESTQGEYKEIVEKLSCIDGIAMGNRLSVTIHWCHPSTARDQSLSVLRMLRSVEFD